MMNRTFWKLVCTLCLLSVAATVSAHANTILNVGLTDPHSLGNVINGIQAGGQVNRDIDMINYLITVPVGTTQDRSDGDHYLRSANNFGVLPSAIDDGNQNGTTGDGAFTGNKLLLTLTSGFRYLLAAYDGPNGGAQVWDISGIPVGTTLEITRYALPTVEGSPGTGPLVDGAGLQQPKYQMTGWTLLNPGASVPDTGTTLALFGLSMSTLAYARRRFSKRTAA
jgi:hypothetical protein